MNNFIKTLDNSYTLFSKKYNQYYHNIKEGAIQESLNKHVIPAISFFKSKKELNILDICFGLGYNSLSTIYYIQKNNLNIKLNIYSPELDEKLIRNLKNFIYPEDFNNYKNIINSISNNLSYKSENLNIFISNSNARDYIKTFKENFFDIVYQDAFSSDVNKELWTQEYFKDIYKISKKECILTTYSIATNVRLSLYQSNFFIYEYIPVKRKSSLCFKNEQSLIGKYIDMELKKTRNQEAKALKD